MTILALLSASDRQALASMAFTAQSTPEAVAAVLLHVHLRVLAGTQRGFGGERIASIEANARRVRAGKPMRDME